MLKSLLECDELDGLSVEAETERVAGRVRVNSPIGFWVELVRPLQHGCAEGERPLFLPVEVVHVEVQMELLRALLAGPFRRSVAFHPLAGQWCPLESVHLDPVGIPRVCDHPAAEELRVEPCEPYRVGAVQRDSLQLSNHLHHFSFVGRFFDILHEWPHARWPGG